MIIRATPHIEFMKTLDSNLTILSQRAAIEETKKVFPPLRERIKNALQKLEDQLEAGEESGASQEEITKAKEVIEQAKEATKEKK
jgi:tubulin-specific chaperone A